MINQNLVQKGFPVIPVMGNHDTYPQDDIKNFKAKDNKAIDEWSPTWADFIHDKEAMKTFLDFGYFKMPL